MFKKSESQKPPLGYKKRVFYLVAIAAQTTAHVMLLRYSRTCTHQKYISSTAIFMSELVKLFVALFVESGYNLTGMHREFVGSLHQLRQNPAEAIMLCIPAGLYAVQNNLLLVAISNLNTIVYQITYQLKILTTAAFSVLLLDKKLDVFRWLSLVALIIGVAMVQVGEISTSHSQKMSHSPTTNGIGIQNGTGSLLVGLGAILCACVLSGIAGILYERAAKYSSIGGSMWRRSLLLSFSSVPFSFLLTIYCDFWRIRELGFFHAYNVATVGVIVLQAVGGFLVAMVVSRADSIVKVFGTSLSFVLSAAISFLFGFAGADADANVNMNRLKINWFVALGCALVVISTILYNIKEVKAKATTAESRGEKMFAPISKLA